MAINTLNIGQNIKKLRAEKGVTQEQLAEHLSITYQSVSKWENNITSPDLYLIPAIAEYFEVPTDELFKQNMKGYRNKAQRLLTMYEQSKNKEDFDKADAEYEKIFAENKADGEDMRLYGYLNECHSYTLGKKAEELYKDAISTGYHKGIEVELQLLGLLSKTSRNEENIANQEEALKNAPDNAKNWRLLVSAYDLAKMYEKAFDTAQKGLEKFPNDAGLLNSIGFLCKSQHKYEEAIEYHKKAIEQNPKDIQIMLSNYYAIAYCYGELKKYKEAVEAWGNLKDFYAKNGFPIDFQELAEKEAEKVQALVDDNTH